MASQTTNLHLVKPTYLETADAGVFNGNMDLIDAAYGTLNTTVSGKVATNQGSGNAGKFLIVNSSGNVEPTTVPNANGVSF